MGGRYKIVLTAGSRNLSYATDEVPVAVRLTSPISISTSWRSFRGSARLRLLLTSRIAAVSAIPPDSKVTATAARSTAALSLLAIESMTRATRFLSHVPWLDWRLGHSRSNSIAELGVAPPTFPKPGSTTRPITKVAAEQYLPFLQSWAIDQISRQSCRKTDFPYIALLPGGRGLHMSKGRKKK